jgi:hypothetical protein
VSGKSYRFRPGEQGLDNLPIQKWSTKTLAGEWHYHAGDVAVSKLESAGEGRLSGSIVHRFPVPLEEYMLIFGGRIFFPRAESARLLPNIEWEPGGTQGKQRLLRYYLTGTRGEKVQARTGAGTSGSKIESEIRFTAEPYNPLNHDRGDLVRMLTFHRSAGGVSYTGLAHAALANLELVGQMQLGRAILLARIPTAATSVELDQREIQPVERDTFVRLVLPVKYTRGEEVNSIPDPSKILNPQ